MTLYLDSSALVAAVIEGRGRTVVLESLETDSDWCASALAFAEALALLPRLSDERVLQDDVEDALRLLWDRVAVVPVDQTCLDRAAQIAREQPVRISDAIHLAAADRLPRPLRFITFDSAQIPVALSMGYDVVSS
jgi:predicted nucleic acid-binding protein